jgi:hypothetical protein
MEFWIMEPVEEKMFYTDRRPNIATIREALVEKYGGACAFCGTQDVPLEVAHIIPLSAGGTDELENFILLCPNCHRRIDNYAPREAEFVDYLVSLLALNPSFRDVSTELPTDVQEGFVADISATRESETGWRQVIIECKSYSAFSSARLNAALYQVRVYRKFIGDRAYILAFPGRVSEKQKLAIVANNVELWDIDYLATTFSDQVEQVEHPYFKPLLQAVLSKRTDVEDKRLLAELKACQPGKEHWGRYQRLVSRILESLFCPPLSSPLTELPDVARVNRRDVIMPNYASNGFWQFMRESYGADYVITDAKNYKGPVKKKEALQVANYLKPHGTGLFGLIVCRTGGDKGCIHTLREQWMAYRKMILILNDEDLEAMLLAKSSGGNPEDIIRQRIEEFRLSM